MVGVAGSNFSNEKRQKMAICSPVCSPVRPCSPVLDCLNSDMSRPNQRPPAGQPLQGRSTPSTSPARPWLGAAACLGPSSLNPLRRCAQQSKSAARITRTGNGPGVPFEGGPPWGRCVFSRWLAVHHSPFTVYFHHPLARKGGSNYPHTYLLERTYVHDRNARAHGFALERWRSRPPVDK